MHTSQTSQHTMASLVAEFAELTRKLMTVEDPAARRAMLEELRALLQELRAAAQAEEREFPQ